MMGDKWWKILALNYENWHSKSIECQKGGSMAARKDQQFETVLGAFREAGKGYSLEEIAARIGVAIRAGH